MSGLASGHMASGSLLYVAVCLKCTNDNIQLSKKYPTDCSRGILGYLPHDELGLGTKLNLLKAMQAYLWTRKLINKRRSPNPYFSACHPSYRSPCGQPPASRLWCLPKSPQWGGYGIELGQIGLCRCQPLQLLAYLSTSISVHQYRCLPCSTQQIAENCRTCRDEHQICQFKGPVSVVDCLVQRSCL